tara:strand:- start:113 stop:550 length:438 start_codon:yes stop_codon:yes gene_type:complete
MDSTLARVPRALHLFIMEITLTTPAILFPAVSLLMLAYTNRFLAIASIIRVLHNRYKAEGSVVIRRQIENLRARLGLIRKMQTFGIMSLFACILSVIVLFLGQLVLGEILFGLSLGLMLTSLIYCLREIHLSGRALEIEMEDMEK